MKAIRTRALSLAALAALAVLAGDANRATADLTDENFDTPYLSPLPNFEPLSTTLVDRWAGEDVSLVGVDGGITPITGDGMVKYLDAGNSGVYNELKQRIDVAWRAAAIDAGLSTATFFACFDVPAAATNAEAQIYLRYLDVNGAQISTSAILSTNDNGGLDDTPNTWEHLDLVADPVPVGTRYVEAFIQYNNQSLGGNAGYMDKTHLGLTGVPEPATIGLSLACCSLAALRRRRGR